MFCFRLDLEKCIAFFNAMYLVLLANDNLLNETQFMRDCTAAIGSACDSIMTDSALIQALIKVKLKVKPQLTLINYQLFLV